MNYTRKCGKNLMECDGNYCSYSSNPIPEFSWWSEVTTFFYSCNISPKLITAKNISDNLFNTKCKAKDNFFSLHDSIRVWDDTSYHSCPYNELCFRDQPVTYTIDKEIKKGYLINDGIIKPNSENFSNNKIPTEEMDLKSTFNHEMSAGSWYNHVTDTV
ncbi:unnamed protein product [Brachionus calyciflorus]|uniref:Uncharacterized protein n=1 Tax=Brachionus calyciflorus TaxID=104777 RepID=A0A814EB68_9BILA|nr:unnamed protein product [Brachionus calyciflorus]